ncbi:MAG: hypothetical protein EXS55_04740 [Candidatus Magasanikbacteria bacterium]|nr:hypothetical protein [Candidatus Magasanikbacteria bacterium]
MHPLPKLAKPLQDCDPEKMRQVTRIIFDFQERPYTSSVSFYTPTGKIQDILPFGADRSQVSIFRDSAREHQCIVDEVSRVTGRTFTMTTHPNCVLRVWQA